MTVTAAAGEDWDALAQRCVSGGLAGVECLAGIPGLVGATPIQNVGAYGQEVAETITCVRGYDRAAGGRRADRRAVPVRLPDQPVQADSAAGSWC